MDIKPLENNKRPKQPVIDKYKDTQTQRNTELLQKRDCAVCVNTYCSDITEYELTQEKCETCGKKLSKTVKGANLFELTDTFKEPTHVG